MGPHFVQCTFTILFKDMKLKVVHFTVKILQFGTPQTIAIKIERFDVTLH